MQIGVAEFLENVSKLKTNEEKINALKFNDSFVLRVILQGAFDPTVEWELPNEDPPYKPNDLVDLEGVLINEARKLQYFVKGFHPNLTNAKRQIMYIELLEKVAPKDAILLLAIKNKKLPWSGIDIYHAYEALPGLFGNMSPPPIPKEVGDTNTTKFQETPKVVCPHCGVEGKTMGMMKLYHFDNCKKKPVENINVQTELEEIAVEPTANPDGVYQATDLSSLHQPE